ALGRHTAATEHFAQALQIAQAIGTSAGIREARVGQGRNALYCAQFSEAAEAYNQALTSSREAKDATTAALALHGLALHALYARSYNEALVLGRQALHTAEAAGQRRIQCVVLLLLGDVHGELELHSEAR